MSLKLLHIDDDQKFLFKIQDLLKDSYYIESLSSVLAVEDYIHTEKFDAILIDIHMPYKNASAVIEEIRSSKANKATGLFVLSSDEFIETKLDYLALGIKDYLHKGMDSRELRLRIENGLKDNSKSKIISIGSLSIDPSTISVILNSEEVALTLIEYKILYFLCSHPNKINKRDDIKSFVWGERTHVDKNVLNSHIYNIKSKLQEWEYSISSVRFKGISIKEKTPTKV